jgi:hypothetical protein
VIDFAGSWWHNVKTGEDKRSGTSSADNLTAA